MNYQEKESNLDTSPEVKKDDRFKFPGKRFSCKYCWLKWRDD